MTTIKLSFFFHYEQISRHGFISFGTPYWGYSNPQPFSEDRNIPIWSALMSLTQGDPLVQDVSNGRRSHLLLCTV